LIRQPEQVAARRPVKAAQAGPHAAVVTPRLGRNRSQPPV